MKSVDEVDDQVRDLSRGGNAAIRGVLFANMYIQGRAHDFLYNSSFKQIYNKSKGIIYSLYSTLKIWSTCVVRILPRT